MLQYVGEFRVLEADAMANLESLIGLAGSDDRILEVDARIDRLLRGDHSPAGPAATRVAGAGGKRLRPALTFACASLGRPDWSRVLNAAVAIELVQVGSLVHDDIFEAATVRRGIPTINAIEGDNFALLAGDYILARAGEAAAAAGQTIAKELAAMIEELCIGQLVETTELFDLDRSIDSQLESIKRKTGVLFGCACRLGAMCAFGDDRVIEGMARFGENFGIAFQLIDDVLDLVSDESRLGKQANIDLASGVYTMPVLLALDTPRSHDLRRALEARDATTARDLVLEARTIPEVIKRAHDYGKFATQALAVLHPLDTPLGGFPERYIDWALEYFPVDAALIA